MLDNYLFCDYGLALLNTSEEEEMGMMDKMMELMIEGMSKEKRENLIEEMMPKMMSMMGSEDMMETMHQIMPRMMENCLTPMNEEQRRKMLTFCRKMLREMEEKFLSKKGEASS